MLSCITGQAQRAFQVEKEIMLLIVDNFSLKK